MKTQSSTSVRWDRTVLGISTAIIFMALVVLVGWYGHIRAAVQIFDGLIPMHYNTALCFLALGAAGIGLSTRRRLLLFGGGGFAALMGAAVILEYATGISFGIDTIFFHPWDSTLSSEPGRMALTTAMSFFLSGGALVILALRRGAYAIFGIVNAVPLSLALTSLVGYSFQISYVLPFGLGLQMALHTSAAFVAYGIAMIGYAWKYAERGPDGLPKWSGGIGVAFLPVLLVAASALFPKQSWQILPLEVAISILAVALLTLAVLRLTTAKVAYKGLLLIATPLILLLIFVGFVVHVRHQSESAQVVARQSKEVVDVSQSLLKHLAEAESAVRGYVITGDETFHSSYAQSLESVTQTTTQLRDVVIDNPHQEASAGEIEHLTAQRMDYLSQVVGVVKTGKREQAEAIIKGMKGADLMEQVRAEVREFSQEEERLDAENRHIQDTLWQRLSWLLVAGTSGSILLASILILLFSGGISRRLQQVRDNAMSLAAGKELATPLSGNDEIADLDRAFHEMAESLDEVTRRERAVIEGTTDGIFIKDLEQRFLMINQAGADFLGKTVEETIGGSVDDFLTPESARRVLDLDAEILAGDKTMTHELLVTTKAGTERTYLTTRGPYRDRRGSVVGIIGINRDMSERKQAEQALATSEKRYRALVDEGQGLICTHDLDGKLLSVNPAAAESLGYAPAEMVGRNLIEYVTPAVQRVFPHYLRRVGSEPSVNGLLNLISKKGEERIWMYRNSRIAEPGAMTYILGYAQDVTESKRAEEELRTLTQRLSLATRVGHIGIWDWDVETNSIDWDERMFDIYGIAPGTAIDYDRWKAAVVAEDLPAAEAALQQTIALKSEEVAEFRIVRPDGSMRHVQASEGVILNRAGKVARVIGLNLDITERKRAEERFRLVVEAAPSAILMVSEAGLMALVNEQAEQLFGYSREELVGQPVEILVPLRYRSQHPGHRALFAQHPTSRSMGAGRDLYGLRKDGSEVPIEIGLNPIQTAEGSFVLASINDITERKLIEANLRENELQLVEAQHIALLGSWSWDIAANTTSWSEALYHVYGIRPEDCPATYEGYLSIVHPDDREHISAMVENAIRTCQGCSYEHRIIWPDKSIRFHHVNLKVVVDEEGRPTKLFGTSQDVTDRVQMEEDLKQARDAALESVRLKSEFLANMSHEIRTPMNGVVGMTGLLRDTALTADQREYTEIIDVSAEALLKIIDEILDFSKIEAGLLSFEKIDFDLRGAVEGAVDLLAEKAQAKGLELASLVHQDVPTALQGDPGRLRQVLTNLAGNAVKFTERGEVVISVTTVGETATHATLRFEIQDTGIGISAEAQQSLFRAFVQADGSTTRKYGGTGLGLAISKQLVELMGGQIGIESTPGHGSTFWFTAEFEKQSERRRPAVETAGSLSGVRVLIVDDNTTNRSILDHQTRSWGMIATQAESGVLALELLRHAAGRGQRFDIAILDLMMPDMDGFQLAEAIKADPSIAAVALVLLPSFGERGHGERAQQAGIAAYLQKPVRQSKLYDCLTAVMSRSAGTEPASPARLVTNHSLREADARERDGRISSLRIIIAEDNLVNQKVALGQLYNLGYRAEAVSNGRELLNALENAEFDVILMDCQMPEMDGFAASAEIRRREGDTHHTTIIAMTANAFDGDDEKCLAAGMDDYLSKPVNVEVLRQKLERWTSSTETASSGEGLGEAAVLDDSKGGNIIDLAQLATLRAMQHPGDTDFVTELIDLFVSVTVSQMKVLHEAVAGNDVTKTRQLAHFLMGSSANVGARQMAALYGELEREDRTNGNSEALLNKLDQEFELVREALKAERRGA